jgi:glycosyltransferase involved in cell wall biosynthesis
MTRSLVVLERHPVQYHAPVYRAVQALGVPVVAVYGSDCSVAGYKDREFGVEFSWDVDLLSGYEARFLNRVGGGRPPADGEVRADGLGRVLAEIDPAAILLLGYWSRFDRGAIRSALRAGRPILFRGETTDHTRRRSWLKSVLRDALLRRFYARCRRLLYIGQRSLAHFRRLGCPESKLVFSPYCVETSPFRTDEGARTELRDATRAELGVRPDQLVFLFSGKLVPRKGVDLLPAAVRQLPADLAGRVVLVFLGDGELRGPLARAAEGSPAVPVRFPGFQNQTRLSRFYQAADLLILPSRESESWGLVVNEALHHGLPCVVSDRVGSAPDLIKPGETGEVTPGDDSGQLAGAMTRAARLIGRPEVRQRCRAVAAGYAVEAAAAGLVSAFRSVLSE